MELPISNENNLSETVSGTLSNGETPIPNRKGCIVVINLL